MYFPKVQLGTALTRPLQPTRRTSSVPDWHEKHLSLCPCRHLRVTVMLWPLRRIIRISACMLSFSITFKLFTFCKIKCSVICLELNCAWSVWKICFSDLWFSLSENRVRGKCSYWHGGALCVTWRKDTTAHTGSGRERIGGEETFQGGWKKFCFFEDRKEWLEVRARPNHVGWSDRSEC